MNGYVEPTYAMRQEPVVASVICRQPILAPTDRTRPSEPGDGYAGRSPAQPRGTARRRLRALLRHQLIVLRRNTKTPWLTWPDRLSLAFLARWVPNWKQVLQIIQPDTLLRWHREGFRLFWKLKSRQQMQTQTQRLHRTRLH